MKERSNKERRYKNRCKKAALYISIVQEILEYSTMSNKNQHCSFCGKPKEETRRLITGPDGACICDECVEICKSMVEEWENEKEPTTEVPLKKPAEIKA